MQREPAWGAEARRAKAAGAIVALAIGAAAAAPGQLTERPLARALTNPAIAYATRPTKDAVAELAGRIADGSARLEFDAETGYLRSALDALHVPVVSQMLVMSKTGVQGLHTGPENPRAIYFTDAVTVGYIRGAPLLEFAVHDPEQGVVFYTIDQKPQASVQIDRPSSCLRCHVAYNTLHVPGMLARSVFIAPDGLPLGQFGSYDADDRTPFRRRWGGWYVSGSDGGMTHIGNAFITDTVKREAMVSDDALTRIEPHSRFDGAGYLSTHSDIVALMVFQHQSHMTNLITRLGWETRMTGSPSPEAVAELVDYALFVDETPLPAPIKGSSGFAEGFAALGPADHQGRSLRQFDLDRRLMRYPCSYMVYSAGFRALPEVAKHAVFVRMWDILSGRETSPKYRRMPEPDRRAVVDILRETIHDLPADIR